MADLPVTEALPALRAALLTERAAVLVAPPGAGKTTMVPLALLDESWLGGERIVVLEPRRLATRAAARRMAHTTGTEVGELVGFQTRDERRIGRDCRVEVVTEGVLTRRLQNDPELPGVGLVVFDEVHERNLPTDVGLALCLDVRRTLRADLRLLAMSATADAGRFARVLGVDAPAPVVASEGRAHPIDVRWLPMKPREWLEPAVAAAVMRALRETEGDVLVFLPGIGEISRVEREIEGRIGAGIDVRVLAGALPPAEQDAALAPCRAGRRKVVLSTDIAETSLTVEGVSAVVDAGRARVPRYDVRTGMTRLTTIATSRSSADQRAGRAGRLGPGVAYRLWSKLEHAARPAQLPPEIAQVDLAGLALELAAWGTPAEALDFLDQPPPRALRDGQALLRDLGALDGDGRLTPGGRRMLSLPLHPRLARMVAGAPLADGFLACIVATLVDERDVLRLRSDESHADLGARVELLAGHGGDDRADRGAVARLRGRAEDLARRAGTAVDWAGVTPEHTGAVLLLAYPDRLASRRQPGQFQMRNGNAAWLSVHDTLAHEAFVVAADVDGNRTSARIRLAAAVDADEITGVLADEVCEGRRLVWDRERGDLVERVERHLGRMTVSSDVHRPAKGPATTDALVDRVRATRLAALDWSGTAGALRERVAFLRAHRGDPWPDWSDKALMAGLEDWLAPYLANATGIADVRALNVATLLRARLPWPAGAELDDLAPAELGLPSGRRVAVDYSSGSPRASVRVQDLFGLARHPTIAGAAVVLELLSPAGRPIQVTADLPGFWAGSWAEVRKEMAGRYPKHHWPHDPAAAPPRSR